MRLRRPQLFPLDLTTRDSTENLVNILRFQCENVRDAVLVPQRETLFAIHRIRRLDPV